MGTKIPITGARGPDKLRGLAIILFAFVGCLLLSIWGMHRSTPRLAPEPSPPTQVGLEGFPESLRPLELLEIAQDLSIRERFQGFVASGVLPSGKLDVSKKKSSVRFSFQSPSGLGPQPPRKAGTLPLRNYCGLQSVFVDSTGLFAEKDDPGRTCPHAPLEAMKLPESCTLERVWKLAKKRKISGKGSAKIEFFKAAGGPAYRFRKGKKSFVVSAKNCKKILTGRAAKGRVP